MTDHVYYSFHYSLSVLHQFRKNLIRLLFLPSDEWAKNGTCTDFGRDLQRTYKGLKEKHLRHSYSPIIIFYFHILLHYKPLYEVAYSHQSKNMVCIFSLFLLVFLQHMFYTYWDPCTKVLSLHTFLLTLYS